MDDQVKPIGDCETLLRTDFSPIHIWDGRLLAAAITSEDLEKRGFSVDREYLVDLDIIDARTNIQMQKAPNDRKEVWIAPFECGPVRDEVYSEDGQPAFRVEHDPIEGNDAHAAIYSFVPRKRSGIKGLKAILLPHLNRGLRTLDGYKAERKL